MAHDASVSFSPWDNLSPSYEQLLSAQTQRFLQHFPGTLIVFSFGLAQFFGLCGILGQYSMVNRPL